MPCYCAKIDMTTPQKKKRKSVWRECSWCIARGVTPPFRSGKLKTLQKHQIGCEADYNLEKENVTLPKIEVLTSMVKTLQKQVSELASDVASLKQKRQRKPFPLGSGSRRKSVGRNAKESVFATCDPLWHAMNQDHT